MAALRWDVRRAAPEIGVALAALLAVALLFPGVVLGYEHLWGDFVSWYYPSHEYAADRMRHGELPLWNPYTDSGMPFAGEADHASFYPPSWILHAVTPDRGRLFRGLEIFTLLHVAVGILAVYALLRALGCHRVSALVGGLTYGLGGEFAARSGHVALICAQAWLPIALGGAVLAVQGRLWGLVGASLAVGFIGTAGNPASLVVAVVGLGLLLGPAIACSRRGPLPRDLARGLAVFGFIVLIGLLLASIQLVPMREFVALSDRAAKTYDDIADYSATPASLIMLLVPRFFGWLKFDVDSYWGPNNFVELSAYSGILPLALGVLALRFRPWRETLPWLFLGTLGFWIALGRYGGLHHLLYEWLPLLGEMRAPGRYLLLWSLSVSVLAGLGLDAALQETAGTRREAWRTWLAGLAGAAVALAALLWLVRLAVAPLLRTWQIPFFIDGLWRTTAASLAAAVALGWFLRRPTLRAGVVVALVVAGDLCLQGRGIGLVPDDWTPEVREGTPDFAKAIARDRSFYRVRSPYAGPADLMLARLTSDTGPGRHVLDYRRYTELILSRDSPMFDLLDIKYIVEDRSAAISAPGPNLIAPQYVWLTEGASAFLAVRPTLACEGLDVVLMVNASGDPHARVGEIEVESASGSKVTLPIRLGIEARDVAEGGPATAARPVHVSFFVDVSDSATFSRQHYLAHFAFAPLDVTGITIRHAGGASVLAVKELYLVPGPGGAGQWEAIHSEGTERERTTVYRKADVMPRAFLVPRAREARSAAEALSLVSQPGFDPRREVVVETRLAGASLPAAEPGPADVESYAPERIQIAANVPAGGSWLLLSEVYFPGWGASVDGRTATVVRADGLFRAVRLDEGRHTVVFRYRPRSVTLGAMLSTLGLALVAALSLMTARRQRVLAPPSSAP